MTIEEQQAAIRQPSFLDAIRKKGAAIQTGTNSLAIKIKGEINFVVTGVPVTVTPGDVDAKIDAGENDGGDPLYTWTMPIAWLS